MPRRTLASTVDVRGTGLHTGAECTVRLAPGEPGAGIVFVRADLPGAPPIPARLPEVRATERRTALGRGEATVDTVEHLLAAAHALRLDDLLITLDGPEPPMLDGSFLPWWQALQRAGVAERDGEAAVVRIAESFTVTAGGGRYVVSPGQGLRLTAMIEWPHPVIGRQSADFTLAGDTFESAIAPARTFGFLHEVEELKRRGLLQGASSEMAVVLSEEGVATGALRWPDEFVRHKLGDILGDLALVGARIEGWIVADKPSHQGNVELAQAIERRGRRTDPTAMDIRTILAALPHRYPFLLVDRIIELEPGVRIVGLKNVTINEPFFQGHFPDHPIMPGVLIVEAMAQAGGMLLMDSLEHPASKVVYFMAIDGVKFRRPVLPGDQLRLEVELVQFRGSTSRTRGRAYVDGQLAAEAEMMAKVMDR
jgi:UDP-3-O-[3-hydroxymyristoyl] N-acetylglucosamine deacetylase/3-hydroxyacyl-[acyl-carrier-protein] dehydratase